MVTEKLEAGKLYQVKHWQKGWIIAEYVKEMPPRTEKYSNIYLEPKFSIGPEKTRDIPLSHLWKFVRAQEAYPSTFTVEDRKMEIRDVTPEAIATIAFLKLDIKRLEQEFIAKKKELREFCE